jgi:hypothetical protein
MLLISAVPTSDSDARAVEKATSLQPELTAKTKVPRQAHKLCRQPSFRVSYQRIPTLPALLAESSPLICLQSSPLNTEFSLTSYGIFLYAIALSAKAPQSSQSSGRTVPVCKRLASFLLFRFLSTVVISSELSSGSQNNQALSFHPSTSHSQSLLTFSTSSHCFGVRSRSGFFLSLL